MDSKILICSLLILNYSYLKFKLKIVQIKKSNVRS